jgi:hypothetical protein
MTALYRLYIAIQVIHNCSCVGKAAKQPRPRGARQAARTDPYYIRHTGYKTYIYIYIYINKQARPPRRRSSTGRADAARNSSASIIFKTSLQPYRLYIGIQVIQVIYLYTLYAAARSSSASIIFETYSSASIIFKTYLSTSIIFETCISDVTCRAYI